MAAQAREQATIPPTISGPAFADEEYLNRLMPEARCVVYRCTVNRKSNTARQRLDVILQVRSGPRGLRESESSSRRSTTRPTPPNGAKNKTRKPTGMCYPESMTAEAILQKSVRYDRSGKPLEVVISYEEFVDFVETYGLDLSDDEKDSVREAKADREAGRMENFVALEDLEKELGI